MKKSAMNYSNNTFNPPALFLLVFACLFISTSNNLLSQSVTWAELQPAGVAGTNWRTSSMSSDGAVIIAGATNSRLYISTDYGSNWTETQPAGNANKFWFASSMSSDGNTIAAAVYASVETPVGGRVYISTNRGNSWTETQPAGNVNRLWNSTSMSSDGTKIIVGAVGRLYVSSDRGSSWTETRPAGDESWVWQTTSMSSDGSIIIAGIGLAFNGRLYMSADFGISWSEIQPAGDTNQLWFTTSMSSGGTKIIAGTFSEEQSSGRLYISTNSGSNWIEVQPAGDVERDWYTTSMSSDGAIIIAGTWAGRLYISTDGGNTWSETQPAGNINDYWMTSAMSSDASKIIAGGRKLYINDGVIPVELVSFQGTINNSAVELNWQTATETNNLGFEIERKQENNNWNKIGFASGSGTTSETCNYSFNDKNLQAGKYYYRLKQIDFDGSYSYSGEIEIDFNPIPIEFNLSQNFPNPFNPSTTIKYQLPVQEHVSLKIFNSLGEKVATLVNELKSAGYHEVNFNSGDLSSGVYFYRIQAGSFTGIKKFVLLR